MDDKKEEFGNRYQHVQKILTIVVTVIISLFGLGIIVVGFLLCFSENKYMPIIAVILIIIGIADIVLGVKFFKITLNRIKNMPLKEAAYRYSRITGKK